MNFVVCKSSNLLKGSISAYHFAKESLLDADLLAQLVRWNPISASQPLAMLGDCRHDVDGFVESANELLRLFVVASGCSQKLTDSAIRNSSAYQTLQCCFFQVFYYTFS